MKNNKKILFYGYGNPGRQDDALGISFVDEIQKWVKAQKISNIDFDTNYQLNIEDAEAISNYDIVIFADASMEPINSFDFTEVEPNDAQVEFTMHAVSVSFVVDLCRKMYGKTPKAYLIHIKGYEWNLDFDKSLTEKAKQNLQSALLKTKEILQQISDASVAEIKQIIQSNLS